MYCIFILRVTPIKNANTWLDLSAVLVLLARDSMLIALYAIARPSLCLSHGWFSQKRLKSGSCNFHHTVAPSLQFLRDKFHPEILKSSPNYLLALCVNISKTVGYEIRPKLLLMTNIQSCIWASIDTKVDDLGITWTRSRTAAIFPNTWTSIIFYYRVGFSAELLR